MSSRSYLSILRAGIYLSLITVFFVFRQFLFPYITSKQIAFNILMEILFVVWLAFIIKYPSYRPKKSYVSYGILAFALAMIASCFASVDVNMSVWGDIERMLGVFHIIHYFIFYLIIITAFRSWKDWNLLFLLSIFVATLVSFKGFADARTTIGNKSYVAGYLIFNMFFCVLLLLKTKDWWRWFALLPIPAMAYTFAKTDTSGGYVALGLSIPVILLLYLILSKNKKLKIVCGSLAVIMVLVGGLAWFNKDSDFVKNNWLLNPISSISFQKNTFQTRLISWNAGLIALKEHPLLGVGHGNYAVIFDKYFDSKFYNYARSETYFDRAHNNLIDIVSTTGIIGLLTYLSIFAALGYYLWTGFRQKKIGQHDFIIIIGLILAYFIQNLVVFDSHATYMGLMLVLAYVFWLVNQNEEGESASFTGWDYSALAVVAILSLLVLDINSINYFMDSNLRFLGFILVVLAGFAAFEIFMDNSRWIERSTAIDRKFGGVEIVSLVGFGLLMSSIIYTYNLLPSKMLYGTIAGQTAFMQTPANTGKTVDTILKDAMMEYQQALSYDTILDRDSRTTFIKSLVSNYANFSKADENLVKEAYDYAISLSEANLKYNQADSMAQMIHAQILNVAAGLYQDEPEKFSYYSNQALVAIDQSIAATPHRIPVYFQKAQIMVNRGETDQAIEMLKSVIQYNPDYYDTYCHIGRLYLMKQDKTGAEEWVNQCVDRGGAGIMDNQTLGYAVENYQAKSDYVRLVGIYEKLVEKDKKNANFWTDLAKLYATIGEKDKAIAAAKKVIELDPAQAVNANAFITSLEGR